MINRLYLPLLLLLLLAGCRNEEREKQLQAREAALTQREQELLLREQKMVLREEAVAQSEQRHARQLQVHDSLRALTPADSTLARMLPGVWATRMSCIETDCSGSAIGDSKSEQWQISYQGATVLVKATVNDQIVRVYTGALNGSTLELTAQHLPDEPQPAAQMTVQLQAANDQRLEGRREITRSTPCRIVYALELTKEKASIPTR